MFEEILLFIQCCQCCPKFGLETRDSRRILNGALFLSFFFLQKLVDEPFDWPLTAKIRMGSHLQFVTKLFQLIDIDGRINEEICLFHFYFLLRRMRERESEREEIKIEF